MKKFYLMMICISFFLFNSYFGFTQDKHLLKISIDTKKMTNIDCNLGADGEGGPSTLKRVYAHCGLCTTGETYCQQQITPYGSKVWEHVVGNWGANPQDDGIGLMTAAGNGVYTLEYVVEDYFSDPKTINMEWNDAHTIQSTIMPAGATPYVIGIVFRDPTGVISGRDDNCYDLFIMGINKNKPQVIQSYDLGAAFPAVSVTESIVTGTKELRSANSELLTVSPNPFKTDANIRAEFKQDYPDLSVDIFNITGQNVRNLFKGAVSRGVTDFYWNGRGFNENELPGGMYLVIVKSSGTILSTQKIILNK